ncbi:MAG: discoidin domain-containing protein [Tepidisphaeraceae bacterium]
MESLEARCLLSTSAVAAKPLASKAAVAVTSRPKAQTAAIAAAATADVTSLLHTGLLNTDADYARIAEKINEGLHPWIDDWNVLIANSHAQLTYTPHPVQILIRGTTSLGPENYSRAYNDAAAAYQTALRWKITGDTRYADKAIQILNAWGSTCTQVTGDSNSALASGLYGYQFAIAGEMMRNYTGWAAADFTQFKSMMTNAFLATTNQFLSTHWGAASDHYWANWDLCNIAAKMAIGVLTDSAATYNDAVNYFKSGVGNGNINNGLVFLHPGKLGQWQESGRDQGHNTLGIPLLAAIAQIAWNQGEDLYSYNDNAILAATEYVAKYNLNNDVPYVTYANSDVVQPVISSASRGTLRAGFETIYNHYANIAGIAAPYTAQYAATLRPDGGGGNYGTTSGGFDQLGFDTLTDTLDPIATGAKPSSLTATVYGSKAVLSWWGTTGATSYNIKRATSATGPFVTVGQVVAGSTTFTDYGIPAGATYYYAVSAVTRSGESANSDPVAAGSNSRLLGTTIGSAGSFNNTGAGIQTVFDGSIRNYYDAANATGDWAGLDFGAGVTDTITQIRYTARLGFESRIVGGKFQASNDPTFASGVATLYTITSAPAAGVMTSANVSNTSGYRYVRYLGPTNGYCNVAEVEFYGKNKASAPPAAPGTLSGASTPAGIALSWNSIPGATGYTLQRATTIGGPYTTVASGITDTTFIDTLAVSGTTYSYIVTASNAAGSSSASSAVSATCVARPASLIVTQAGRGRLALSWSATAGAVSYTIKRSFTSTGPYTAVATVTGTDYLDTGLDTWRPYFYVVTANDAAGGESRNSVEGTGTPAAAAVSGTVIGTTGSNGNNSATTKTAALDGNLATFFDAAQPNGAWVGLDLGAPTEISDIRFAPRSGYESRMLNGVFQGANTADFSDAVTLAMVASTPVANTYTSLVSGSSQAFRYVRYLSPNGGYCNVAEVEFDKIADVTPTALLGTAGSFGNNAATTKNAALDGNPATFFDSSQASGAWVGEDLGAPTVITSVRFAPRSGYASRMVGGLFQGANSADFSDAVTLAAITATPAASGYTSLPVAGNQAYRYVRYVGPTNSYGNVAEVEFYSIASAPTVTSVVVNDGAAQHSMVDSLSIQFSQPVTLGAGSISVLLNGTTPISATAVPVDSSDTQYLVTFNGAGIVNHSLADGAYTLVLSGAAITNDFGISLPSDTTFNFYRLFGDIDGDRAVTSVDQAWLRKTYGASAGQANFNPAFDYDGDGVITTIDQAQFRKRYGITI